MTSVRPSPEPLRLSETETRVLQLYDSLQQLQFQRAQLEAQQHIAASPATPAKAQDVLEREDLEARTQLSLRNSVIEGVMMVQPLLEAVHNGTQASPVERDLSPLVERRDMAAAQAANQASDLRDAIDQLTKLEVETRDIGRKNAALASDVLQLAANIESRQQVETVDDTHLNKEIADIENELATSRQRWKVIKGVTSAVVAGSGVDWVRDKRLLDMVLDPPD